MGALGPWWGQLEAISVPSFTLGSTQKLPAPALQHSSSRPSHAHGKALKYETRGPLILWATRTGPNFVLEFFPHASFDLPELASTDPSGGGSGLSSTPVYHLSFYTCMLRTSSSNSRGFTKELLTKHEIPLLVLFALPCLEFRLSGSSSN